MGKAKLTIAVSGEYNGKALQRVEEDLRKVEVQAANAAGGISSAFTSIGGSLAEAGGKIHNIGDSIDSVGGKVTKGLTLPIMAGAAAAFDAAKDYESAFSKVRSTINDTDETIEDVFDSVKNVYENGWGESLDQVADAAIRVKQNFYDINPQALEAITQTCLMLADTMDMDVNESIRGSQALINGFGLSAEEAMDMLVAGAQNGLDKSGELGDNLAEYAQLFQESGYSASEMFSLLQAGLDAGAYNLDKVNDLVKEFGIKMSDGSVKDACEELGGDFKRIYNEAQKAGKSNKETFSLLAQQITKCSSEQEKAAAISAIWGSQGEDNGIRVIEALANVTDTYDDVAGAAQKAGEAASDNFATKAETAMRKLRGSIEPLGEPLLRIASDFADMATEAAEWFASLDEGEQNAVLACAGIAAAAGPVISIGGKGIRIIGDTVTGIGKLSQSAGVLVNKAKQSSDAMKKAASETKNASTAQKELAGSTTAATSATNANASAVKAQTAAAKTGTTAMKGLKVAMGGIGALAAVSVIATVASVIGRAAEETAALNKATGGLKESSDAVRSSLERATGGATGYGSALRSTIADASECIQSQAELAGSLSDMWDEVGTKTGAVDIYMGSIERLADKTNLTAAEQAELVDAINGINEICGTTYSVIDKQNGKLSENKDAILSTVNAWEKQALAQAAAQASSQLMEQHIKNLTGIQKAEEAVAEAQRNMNAATSDFDAAYWASKMRTAEEELKRLKGVDAECTDEMQRQREVINELSGEYSNAAQEVRSYIESNSEMAALLEGLGVDVENLTNDLGVCGVTQQNLSDMGASGMEKLASSYDGSITSIIGKLSDMGISVNSTMLGIARDTDFMSSQVQNAFANANVSQDEFMRKITETGISVQDFELLTSDQIALLVQEYANGNTNIKALLDEYIAANRNAGQQGGSGLMNETKNGINSGRPPVINETKRLVDDIEGTINSLDSYSWGIDLMGNLTIGLASGIPGVSAAASAAASKIRNILGHSVPKEGPLREGGKGEVVWGEHLLQNLMKGVANETPSLLSTISALSGDMRDEMASMSLGKSMNMGIPLAYQRMSAPTDGAAARALPGQMTTGTNDNRKYSYEVHINIYAQPGQDATSIAEAVDQQFALKVERDGRYLR